MTQMIVLSGILVIALLVFNSLLNHICGTDSSGEYSKVIEGTLTIAILYLVIIGLFGNSLVQIGIPFVDQLDTYKGLSDMFQQNPSLFTLECAELISLTFVISLISNYIPSSWGGNGMTGKIIRSIVLVLLGIVVSHYLLSLTQETLVFSYALTALQCFISGTALVTTPAMLIGKLLHVDSNHPVVSFLLKKLPETKIGKSLSTAASNSIILVFVVMIFESMYGDMSSLLSQVPALLSLFAPLVIMIIGLKLMVRSLIR